MLILGSTLLLGLVSGFVTWLLFKRWPNVDLAAPRATSRGIEGELRRHPRLALFLESRLDTRTAAGLALTVAAAIVVVGFGAFGLILFMVRTKTGFAHFDVSATRFGAQHATALSTSVLRWFTQLGGAVVLVPLALVVAVVEGRRGRPFSVVAFLTVTVGGQFLVADLIKWGVDRVRPNLDRLTGFGGSSFPSGHATAAAATFAAFALLVGRRRSVATRALLAAAAVALAVSIGWSRVMLGVHWMTDVLAGLALGWAWFALCCIAFGGRLLVFGAPAESVQQAALDSSTATGADRSRMAGNRRRA